MDTKNRAIRTGLVPESSLSLTRQAQTNRDDRRITDFTAIIVLLVVGNFLPPVYVRASSRTIVL
eukprot:COSAG01_NODE_2609_length_7389_cov_19.579467_9_plen_64_part_00